MAQDGKQMPADIEAQIKAFGNDREAIINFLIEVWPDASKMSGDELDDLARQMIAKRGGVQ